MFKSFINKLTHSQPTATDSIKIVQKKRSPRSLGAMDYSPQQVNGEVERSFSQETVDSCESVKPDSPTFSSVNNLFSFTKDLDTSSFPTFPPPAMADLKESVEMLAKVLDVGDKLVKLLPDSPAFNCQFVVNRADFGVEEPVLNGWYVCKGVWQDQTTTSDPLLKTHSLVPSSKSYAAKLIKHHSKMIYHGFVLHHLHNKFIAWIFEEQAEMLLALPADFHPGDWFKYFLSGVYTKCSSPIFEIRQVEYRWQMLVPVVSPEKLDSELVKDFSFDPAKSIWCPALGPIAGRWPANFPKNILVDAWITRASLGSKSESKGQWTFVEEDNQEDVRSTTLRIAQCFFAFPTTCFIEGVVVRRVGKTAVILSEQGELCYCSCTNHRLGDHVQFLVWSMVRSFFTYHIAINCLVFCQQFLEVGAVKDEFYIRKKSIDGEDISSRQFNYPGLGIVYDPHHLLYQGFLDMVVCFEGLISPSSPSFQWIIKRMLTPSTVANSASVPTSPHSADTIDLSSDNSFRFNSPIACVDLVTPPKPPLNNQLTSLSQKSTPAELFTVQKKVNSPPQSRENNLEVLDQAQMLSLSFTPPKQLIEVDCHTPTISKVDIAEDSQPGLPVACSSPSATNAIIDLTKKNAISVVLQVTSTLVCLYSTNLSLPQFLVPISSFKEKPQPGDWFYLRMSLPMLGTRTKGGKLVLKGVRAKPLLEEPPMKTCLLDNEVVLMTEVSVGQASSSGLRYFYSQPFPLLLDVTGLLSDYKLGEQTLVWCGFRNFPLKSVHWNVVALHNKAGKKQNNSKSISTSPVAHTPEAEASPPSPAITEPSPPVSVQVGSSRVGLVCSSTPVGNHYIIYCTSLKPNGMLKKSDEVKLGDWITFSGKLVNGVLRISSFKVIEPIEKALVTTSQLLLPCEITVPQKFRVTSLSKDNDLVLSELVRPIYDSNKLIDLKESGKRMRVVVACDSVGQPNKIQWTVVHLKA